MKEVTKEKVQKYTVYEAIDGTEFHDKAECMKYEESANGVIRARIAKITVSQENEWELFSTGSDEHDVIGIRMDTEKDLDTVKQFFLLECPWYNSNPDNRDEKFAIIDEAFKKKDIVFFGINCDGDYYWINSRQNIIDNLMNLGNE